VPWCWLAFGSEGRLEQTLDTDQDNGLVFVPESEADAETLRERFLPFARRVNALLDACGFPLCKGEVMAGNPRWCLSMTEWRGQFASWISTATPEDLLNATIFFDFRAVAGDVRLAMALQRWLLGSTGDNDLFLRFMAANALRGGPPLGRIRDFVVDRESGLLDLKRDGSRIFVDVARILALALGIPETATVGRLQLAGSQLGWPRREVDACLEAFDFIQQLRLRGQQEKAGPPNRIAPAALNELERAFLKESFRQARKLQQRLQLRYQL
jgi:CBS domain-containing protein